MPAVLGYDDYRTNLDVWRAKVAGEEPVIEDTEPMRMGRILEPLVAERYADEQGFIVTKCEETLRSPEYPFLLATPDYFVNELPEEQGHVMGPLVHILEVKTSKSMSNRLWGTPGTDQVPYKVLIQAHAQMIVTRMSRCDVAVLQAGQYLKVYTVFRNHGLARTIIDAAESLWEQVRRKEEPPSSDPAQLIEQMAAWYPRAEKAEYIDPDAEIEALVLDYRRACEAIKAAESDRDRLKAALCARIGEHAGIGGDGYRCTWVRVEEGTTTDWKQVAEEMRKGAGFPDDAWAAFLRGYAKPRKPYTKFDFRWDRED
jgi:putative phage-type endonuclease